MDGEREVEEGGKSKSLRKRENGSRAGHGSAETLEFGLCLLPPKRGQFFILFLFFITFAILLNLNKSETLNVKLIFMYDYS